MILNIFKIFMEVTKMKKFTLFAILVMMFAMPIAFAEDAVTAEPTLYQNTATQGKEYGTMSRVMDRIGLAFTFNSEKKLEVMNKIQTKRESHYQFLMGKGKIEQANKFKEGTQSLVQNFEQQRERIQQKLNAMNQDKIGLGDMNQTKQQIRDPTTHEDGVEPQGAGKYINQ